MLREKINDGMKDAMKSQDKLRLSTLRLVNAAIKNADIQERGEIAIIAGFLPKQMSESEMMAAIAAAVAETGASSMKDMGKVIGVLRGKYAGQMDFGKASALVKGKLSGAG